LFADRPGLFHDVDFRIAQDESLLSEPSSLCHHFSGVLPATSSWTIPNKEFLCDHAGGFYPGDDTVWMPGRYIHLQNVNHKHGKTDPLETYWHINQLHIIGIEV